MQYFKEDAKGVREVCTLVEEYAKDYAKGKVEDIVKNLIKLGLSNEDISTATHLSTEEVEKLRNC